MKWVGNMETKGLGKRINMVRKDRGFTADRLSELCNINATYLRQIEGGTKVPSLPVFINICNALKISPDYLLCDALEENEVSKIRELTELWENTLPSQQEIAAKRCELAVSIICSSSSFKVRIKAALSSERKCSGPPRNAT